MNCRGLSLFGVLALLYVFTGCASDAPVPVQALVPIVSNQPVAPVPLLENMTVYQWRGDFRRLEDDIERAMNKEEWARLKQEERDGVIHAKGVVPDNRHGWIIAWQIGETDVAVAVRVGLFGEQKLEGTYAARLKQVMAGKPKPKRNWGFELPPLPGLGSKTKEN